MIQDPQELLRHGVCRARLPRILNCDEWAERLSHIPLSSMTMEGDHELPLYQNILEEEDFPFYDILNGDENNDTTTSSTLPSIPQALAKHFEVTLPSRQLKLDDAFGVHYHSLQHDTSGARHQDPSDITINICLHKSTTQGSHVLFHGTQALQNVQQEQQQNKNDNASTSHLFSFLVEQIPGTATIHYGHHPHETTPIILVSGDDDRDDGGGCSRTNVILTYWYADGRPSNADTTRTCYA
jgi:hypothetical protein